MIKLNFMKRSPLVILSAIFELVRLVVLALMARSLLSDTHTAVSLFLLRLLLAGNFIFPALLFLAWFNSQFAHYLYIFIPLKITLLLTALVSLPALFSNTTRQILTGNFLAVIGGVFFVILVDSLVLVTAFRIALSLKKSQAEPPAIETVELS